MIGRNKHDLSFPALTWVPWVSRSTPKPGCGITMSSARARCPIVDTWWQTETGGILITPLPGAILRSPALQQCRSPASIRQFQRRRQLLRMSTRAVIWSSRDLARTDARTVMVTPTDSRKPTSSDSPVFTPPAMAPEKMRMAITG